MAVSLGMLSADYGSRLSVSIQARLRSISVGRIRLALRDSASVDATSSLAIIRRWCPKLSRFEIIIVYCFPKKLWHVVFPCNPGVVYGGVAKELM